MMNKLISSKSDQAPYEDNKKKTLDKDDEEAIKKLNESAKSKEIEILSLAGGRRHHDHLEEDIITINKKKDDSGNIVSHGVNVSHYIGVYSCKVEKNEVVIEISPNWSEAKLLYILGFSTGIFLPPSDDYTKVNTKQKSVNWYLVLLWRSYFDQAHRKSHIPKEYRIKHTNDHVFKGRLDVYRQIRENIVDQSKFCCTYSEITIDTTINRTIRYVFLLLSKEKNDYSELLRKVRVHDDILAARGVKNFTVHPREIDAIRYTRMSEVYKPLMQISKIVIQLYGANTDNDGKHKGVSFLIDISELWENYLFAILKRNLGPDYTIRNTNADGGDYLIEGNRREIRPDMIIYKGVEQPVAILDAKYKYYTQIGKYEDGGVSRGDLHQMVTYMYHYGSGTNLVGLFICPGKDAPGNDPGSPHTMAKDTNHKIGVVNFDVDGGEKEQDLKETDDEKKKREREELEALRGREVEFAEKINELLNKT